jgi:hypothetical protein
MTLPFWYTLSKNFQLAQLQKRTDMLRLPDLQIVGIYTIKARIQSCSVPFVQHSIFVSVYTKSEGLTLRCRVTCSWSERFNFLNRQLMLLPRKKHI